MDAMALQVILSLLAKPKLGGPHKTTQSLGRLQGARGDDFCDVGSWLRVAGGSESGGRVKAGRARLGSPGPGGHT